MSSRLAYPARRLAVPLVLLPLTLLTSGCGGGEDNEKFAPPCPVPSIPRDTSDLRRFRGTGRDITDSALDGRITGIGGSCTRGDKGIVTATISVGIDLVRGPAAAGAVGGRAVFRGGERGAGRERAHPGQADIHVAGGVPVEHGPAAPSGDEVELLLPVTPTKTAAAYRISVGFQLSPAELQANRSRGAGR